LAAGMIGTCRAHRLGIRRDDLGDLFQLRGEPLDLVEALLQFLTLGVEGVQRRLGTPGPAEHLDCHHLGVHDVGAPRSGYRPPVRPLLVAAVPARHLVVVHIRDNAALTDR
jgi:hypothetical protein